MPAVIAAAAAAAIPASAATAVTIGATAISYATIAGYAAFIGGTIAYNSSQNAKARRALNNASLDQGRTVMVRDPLAARRLIYGRCKVSGTIVFMHTTGAKNQYLHLVVVLAGHEVDAITDIYFNDELVELNGSNVPTGKYASVALVNKHRGDAGATADADLVADCGGLWTTDHKLSGCAYLAIKLLWSPDLFPNGLPTISAIVRGKKVYDPRTASTAWSDNVALCVADYLTDSTFGKGIDYARIVEADLIEAANICDEAVGLGASLSKTGDMVSGNRHIGCADCSGILPGYKVTGTGIPTGTVVVSVDDSGTFFTVDQDPTATNSTVALTIGDTESRYTCNGTITSDQKPAEILQDLAGAMAGHIVDTGGKWTIRAGAWRTPALTLTDGDLSGAFSVQPRQSRQDTFNGVKGVFISPANDWAPADFPAVKNDTYMADDGGVRLWRDVQYNFTTSPAMAQRLAKIELERGRQQITCTGTYMLKAMQCMPGDVIAITRSRLGWSSKYFEVVDWTFQQSGDALGVVLNLRETASGVWDWADGEETTIDLAPNSDLPDPFTVPTPSTPTLTSTTMVQSDGTTFPRFTVAWTTPNNIYVEQGGHVIIEFKLSTDSAWIEWGRVDGSLLADLITGVVIGASYNVRLQFINSSGVRGAYSSTATVTVASDTTAPSIPTGLAVVAGTGKSISLSWTANTDDDLAEYGIYRSVSGGAYSKIAETGSNRFVDVAVTIGAVHAYKITAIDWSENESGFSSSASVTPTGITATDADATAPGTPSASSLSSSGTYLSGDGTVFSYLDISVPAMPTLAKYQNLLYKKNGGGGDWLIAAQLTNTGALTVRIDDLIPGIAYDIAVIAFTAFAVPSAITTATSSPFTAPNRSATPSAPASGSVNSRAATILGWSTSSIYFGARAEWAAASDADHSYYEVKCTTTNSDGAVDYVWFPSDGTSTLYKTVTRFFDFYRTTPAAGHVRVRSVNKSGVAGTWLYCGDISTVAVSMGGTAALKGVGTTSSDVAAGNDSRITGAAQTSNNLSDLPSPSTARSNLGLGTAATQNTSSFAVTSLKVGSGSNPAALARYTGFANITLSGGSPSEAFTISLSGMGFSGAPDCGLLSSIDATYVVVYNRTTSSSSTANCTIKSTDGTNIPATTTPIMFMFEEV